MISTMVAPCLASSDQTSDAITFGSMESTDMTRKANEKAHVGEREKPTGHTTDDELSLRRLQSGELQYRITRD